jgi:hypothetical protein
MKALRKKIIAYLLHLFTLPRVKEKIESLAKLFIGEASRYSTGIKLEAIESKETFTTLTKFIKNEKITKEEKRKFKRQVIDILRSSGVVVPLMLIPLPFVSTILLVIMDHLLLSMNIQLLPASFYPENKQGLLTADGVERDLKKERLLISKQNQPQ